VFLVDVTLWLATLLGKNGDDKSRKNERVSYGKEMCLPQLLNYKIVTDVNIDKTYNHQCQPITQLVPKFFIPITGYV
jgi:hypothetical protein